MRIRPSTLWQVPVYCLVSSWISFYITVYLGGLFFTVQTVGQDGVTTVSADPVRSIIFNIVLFAAVLILGGLWFKKAMSKKEIAVSAAIISAVYLIVVLMQLLVSDIPVSFGVTMAYFQNWTGIVASLLFKVTQNIPVSTLLSCFAPFLFVPFGQKRIE